MNHSRRTGAAAGVLMMLALTTAPGAFAQVCVNPAGGGCQLTIQDGVDLATAGQTVTVAPAVYEEEVTVPAGKDGLKIVGDGAVIDNPSNQNAFDLLSNDVTLSGFLVRNSRYGVFVGDEASIIPHGTVLDGLTFERTHRTSVYLAGADDTTITDCRFTAAGDLAVSGQPASDFGGTDHTTVTRSRFAMCDDGCIQINGNTALVSGNKFTQSASSRAVVVYGDDGQVIKNSITRSQGGVYVSGNNPVVTGNKVSGYTGSSGVSVYCPTSCAQGLVSGNKVASAPNDTGGISVSADAPGIVVSKNSATGTNNEGFAISGTGITLTGNRASKNGGDDYESGIEVYGTNHVVTGNSATSAMAEGIYVTDQDNEISGNTLTGNFGDGIQFSWYSGAGINPSATIQGNSVSGNIGEGYSVDGDGEDYSGVVFTDNTADGDRVPFCSDAPLVAATNGGGNSFSMAAPPACATYR